MKESNGDDYYSRSAYEALVKTAPRAPREIKDTRAENGDTWLLCAFHYRDARAASGFCDVRVVFLS